MVQFCYLRLYLATKTIFCRLLQRMAKMDVDWNWKKLGQRFHVQNSTPEKINHQKKLLWLVLPGEICLTSSS